MSPSSYEVGSVAPRDVTVERDVLYTDLEATRLRQEAVEKLVAPIFRINEGIGESKLRQLEEFSRTLKRLAAEGEAADTLFLKLQLSFPGVLQRQELARLRPQAALLLERARALLGEPTTSGCCACPSRIPSCFPQAPSSCGVGAKGGWRSSRPWSRTCLPARVCASGRCRV